MFYKIDPNLLGSVSVLGVNQKQEVIVYYTNLEALERICQESSVSVLVRLPFISAVVLKLNRGQIFELAKNYCVDYLTVTASAKILMREARKVVEVENLHKRGVMGKNVGVAVIDTGASMHLDFVLGKNRIMKFVDFIDGKSEVYDDNGHGTFVAGVLAGSGVVSGGALRGVAPLCDLVILKALRSDGQTQAYKVLEAMQWVYDNHKKYNIRVVCMSFGSTPLSKNDPLTIGANSLWQKGIVVVTAVGNDGPAVGSVKSPGSSPKVITVGCADTREGNVKVADFSSRGPIFDFIKPDLIAPGVEIESLDNGLSFYRRMSGTSVSTPFVAGVVALMLEERPWLTPNEVKALLISRAVKLPYDVNVCGAGLLRSEGV